MTTTELEFVAHENRPPVSAILMRPRGAKALYVFGHGAGAGMNHRFMEAMATALAQEKIATLRYQFPYTQMGRGRPDPRPILLSTVRAAAALGKKRAGKLPLLAGGKSMGGRMTSLAQSQEPLPGVAGLVFLGFPLHAPGKEGSERAEHLEAVRVPMLFVQGTRDKLAKLELLRPVVAGLGQRARLHIIEQGDHSLNIPKRSPRTPDDVLAEVATEVSAFAHATA